MRKKALVLLGLVWLIGVANAKEFNLPFKTLSQSEVAQLAREARLQLQSTDKLEAPRSESPCYVAISFSIPKASLLRLAADAARAQIPLVLRGVGETPILKAEDKNKHLTQEALYGKGWLARHLSSLAPLTEKGAIVLIYPKRFQKDAVRLVPTLICKDNQNVYRAVGDVSLDYGLSWLLRENPTLKTTPLGAKLSDLLEKVGGEP